MSRVSAWRWPPDRAPTGVSIRSSNPRPRSRTRSASSRRRSRPSALRSTPGRDPRLAATARFSATVRWGMVPDMGF